MQYTPGEWTVDWEPSIPEIQINDYIQNFKNLTEYNKRHMKKAGE